MPYLNGAFVAPADATVSALDRGFNFGDGVYEVWRVVQGVPFEFERHRRRLERGIRELAIPLPDEIEADALRGLLQRLLEDDGLLDGEATVYLQVTRGAAPRTHAFPPAGTPPTVFAFAAPFTPREDLRSAGAAAITLPDERWLRCDLKTIQLLPNVMGKQRAHEAGAIEALFVRDAVITEGTHTNLLAVRDGVIRTHPLTHLVLPGVTRAVILELCAEAGLPVREEAVAAAEVDTLDEAFLVGTTTDVMPLVRIDAHRIGSGRPGPIAQRLQAALRLRLEAGADAPARAR